MRYELEIKNGNEWQTVRAEEKGLAHDLGSPWDNLRDFMKPEHKQEMNHFGLAVVLRADRDEWRDGVKVVLQRA